MPIGRSRSRANSITGMEDPGHVESPVIAGHISEVQENVRRLQDRADELQRTIDSLNIPKQGEATKIPRFEAGEGIRIEQHKRRVHISATGEEADTVALVTIVSIEDEYLVCDREGAVMLVAKPWGLRGVSDIIPPYQEAEEGEEGEELLVVRVPATQIKSDGGDNIIWVDMNTASRCASRWKGLSRFNATPPSTSTITTTSDLSAIITVGMPLRFTLAAGDYYAIVTAITANLITIAGAPLTTGADTLLGLAYGDPEMISVLSMFIAGTYADGTDNNLLASDMYSPFKWMQSKFHLVAVSATQASVDTGSEAVVNVQVNNASVLSTGITLGAAGAWVDGGAVAITTANYDVNYGEEIEVACTTAGGTGDAEDLTVQCVFVPE